MHFKNWLTWHAFEFVSRLLRAKMLAFSLCFQPMENLNNAKFQKNTKKTKNTSKKKFDRVLFTFFSNNPAYWTFFSFLLRVKNIAFCLCFGLIHSLGICQNFVGLRVGAKNPAYWTFFSNNPAYWTFLLFLLRVKNIAFCLCFGLIDSLGICRNFVRLSVPERRPRKRAKRKIGQSCVLPGGTKPAILAEEELYII